MIWIRFGKWCSAADNLFVYERVYTNKCKPTPLVVVHFRHVGAPPWDFEEETEWEVARVPDSAGEEQT